MMTSDRDPVTPLLLVREAAVAGERDVVSRAVRELGRGPRPGPADTRPRLAAGSQSSPHIGRLADGIVHLNAHDRRHDP